MIMKQYLAIFLFCSTLIGVDVAAGPRTRLAVPDYVDCERNALTSWSGEVTDYLRAEGRIRLEMATDFDTKERLDLNLVDQDRLLSRLRIKGRTFKPSDWPLIEDANGNIQQGIRATIWICAEQEVLPIINWQPHAEQPSD